VLADAGVVGSVNPEAQYEADANGAINIGARLLEHVLGSRANLTWPITHAAHSSPDERHTSAPNRHTT